MSTLIIINILKTGMMKTKSITVSTLEGIRSHEILEEYISKFDHNNTLVLKLKNLFMGFHIIVRLHNFDTSYINFSSITNIT